MIAPSVLSADFNQLGQDIEMINNSEADWFHLDVMDGVFVPNISFGMPVIAAIAKKAKKPLDTHLMIVQPERYVETFAALGVHILSVHQEACTHLHRVVHQIKDAGMKAGIVLNPHTPVSTLNDIVADADLILLMSVNPGFGGQKFIQNTYSKISELKNLIIQKNSRALIEIDGGVNEQNAAALYAAGADVLVAGNAVFAASSPVDMISGIRSKRLLNTIA